MSSEAQNSEQGGVHTPLFLWAETALQVAQPPNIDCAHLFDEDPRLCPFYLDLGPE